MTAFNWRLSAACRDEDPRLFFHETGEPSQFRQFREARAKAICNSCPVQLRCLVFRLSFKDQLDEAIWAGKDGEERKALRHAWIKRQQRAEAQAAA